LLVRNDSAFCHNCGIRLVGRFCAACGQKAVPLSVTLHDFFHELTHEMLHVDGRIVQSIRRLVLSPGFLTREYIQGRRARWISPIRLYLIFSVVFFGLSALTGFDVGINEGRTDSGWTFSARSSSRIGITADPGEDAEDEARKLGFESAAALQQAIDHAVLTWIPRVMFVLLPFFAGLVALAYRRGDRNYLHHLIFAVHAHAAWFAAAAAAKAVELASYPLGQALGKLAVVFAAVYVVVAFRRVYGKVRFSFARIAFVLVVYLLAFVLVVVAIVLPIILPRVLTQS
jgi:Protein of unknown function (DUF3667)